MTHPCGGVGKGKRPFRILNRHFGFNRVRYPSLNEYFGRVCADFFCRFFSRIDIGFAGTNLRLATLGTRCDRWWPPFTLLLGEQEAAQPRIRAYV